MGRLSIFSENPEYIARTVIVSQQQHEKQQYQNKIAALKVEITSLETQLKDAAKEKNEYLTCIAVHGDCLNKLFVLEELQKELEKTDGKDSPWWHDIGRHQVTKFQKTAAQSFQRAQELLPLAEAKLVKYENSGLLKQWETRLALAKTELICAQVELQSLEKRMQLSAVENAVAAFSQNRLYQETNGAFRSEVLTYIPSKMHP